MSPYAARWLPPPHRGGHSYAELTGTVPSAKSFRESLLMPGLRDADRGIAVALLLTLPTSDEVLAITNCSSWSKVLQEAGIAKPVGAGRAGQRRQANRHRPPRRATGSTPPRSTRRMQRSRRWDIRRYR